MMPEQTPITGLEDKKGLATTLQALIEFYDAFNSRNLKKMAENWAHTDGIVMSNPVGGIKRGWEEIRSVYERIFNGPAQVYVEFYDYYQRGRRDVLCSRQRTGRVPSWRNCH